MQAYLTSEVFFQQALFLVTGIVSTMGTQFFSYLGVGGMFYFVSCGCIDSFWLTSHCTEQVRKLCGLVHPPM